jgi:hypothetical protein
MNWWKACELRITSRIGPHSEDRSEIAGRINMIERGGGLNGNKPERKASLRNFLGGLGADWEGYTTYLNTGEHGEHEGEMEMGVGGER